MILKHFCNKEAKNLKVKEEYKLDLAKISPLRLAEDTFKTRGKRYCVGLIIHLIMFIAGEY